MITGVFSNHFSTIRSNIQKKNLQTINIYKQSIFVSITNNFSINTTGTFSINNVYGQWNLLFYRTISNDFQS